MTDAYRTFKADCTPEGARTTREFVTEGDGFHVEHDMPAGAWTAMTILIPSDD